MRTFFWISSIVVSVIAVVGGAVVAHAEEPSVWANKDTVVLKQQSIAPTNSTESCQGTRSLIFLNDVYQPACVHGDSSGSRLARYRVGSLPAYAYANGTSPRFYPLRSPCHAFSDCVYGQSSDTLLMKVPSGPLWMGRIVIRDVSKQIVFDKRDGGYYELKPDTPTIGIEVNGHTYPAGALGISKNGRWAVIEFHDYGLVRIDLTTLAAKRIHAPGAVYGVANDPSFEIAVSNSGRQVAVVGFRGGIDIHEVTSQCGEALSDLKTVHFPLTVIPCGNASVDRFRLFPGFQSAHNPSLSINGDRLTVEVRTPSGTTQATLAPERPDAQQPYRYIAFGDSFTSGEGEESDSFYLPATNTSLFSCHVSSRSYPFLLEHTWEYVTSNFACSGATTKEMTTRVQDVALATVDEPAVVTLGIGGNDVGLMGKLKTCLGIGTCEWAKPEKRLASAREMQQILPSVIELLSTMKREFSTAHIALVGYPLVINSGSQATCTPLIAALLDRQEREFMTESIRYLNTVLEATAAHAGVAYVDIEDTLSGERLCDAKQTAMNGVRLGDDIAPVESLPKLKIIGAESFHPTPRGHELMSRAFDTYAALWRDKCESCATELAPPAYWTEAPEEIDGIRQLLRSFIYVKDMVRGAQHTIAFPAGSFSPHSDVRLEIHSEVRSLGQFTSNADGSLEAVVTIDGSESGYHTLHAYGTDADGMPVDYYDFVMVKDTVTSPGADDTDPLPVHPIRPESAGPSPNGGGDTNQDRVASSGSLATYDPDISDNYDNPTAANVLGKQAVTSRISNTAADSAARTFSIGALSIGAAAIIGVAVWFVRRRLKHK